MFGLTHKPMKAERKSIVEIVVMFIFWMLCGIGTGFLAQSKGRSFGEGLVLGIVLGFIGLIIEACLPSKKT